MLFDWRPMHIYILWPEAKRATRSERQTVKERERAREMETPRFSHPFHTHVVVVVIAAVGDSSAFTRRLLRRRDGCVRI